MNRRTNKTKTNSSRNHQEQKIKKAIICGSFNPFHDGHLFLVKKALKKYDFIYLIVAQNPNKEISNKSLIIKSIQKILNEHNLSNHVMILENKGLLANYIKSLDTNIIIRGYRSWKDLKYEWELKKQYLKVNKDIVFKLYRSNHQTRKLSSSKIRNCC